MRSALFLSLFMALTLALNAQEEHYQNQECCSVCASKSLHRYADIIFPQKEVAVRTERFAAGVTNWLGQNSPLDMDIYEATVCNSIDRPCVVLIHGGSMKCGYRDNKMLQYLGKSLATRGYVVASIDYRQGWITDTFIDSIYRNEHQWMTESCERFPLDCLCKLKSPKGIDRCGGDYQSVMEASYRGLQDVRSAVRYLKSNNTRLGIDPDAIFLSGYSAGGILALHANYTDANEIPSWLKDKFGDLDIGENLSENMNLAGIISNWGALLNVNHIDADEQTPIMLVHGTCDKVVPFHLATFGNCPNYPMLFGSNSIRKFIEIRNYSTPVEMHTACGYGHNIIFQCKTRKPVRPLAAELEQKTASFLYKILGTKLVKGTRDHYFACEDCYCGECNNASFTYDFVGCRTNCPNPCANAAEQNPYMPENPCNLPYPCTQ